VGWLVLTPGSSSAAHSPYVIFADAHGVPVWWIHTSTTMAPVDGKVLPDGTVAWSRKTGGGFSHSAYEHYSLDGTDLGALSTVGTGADQHDMQQLPNGDYLMEAYVPRSGVDLSSQGGPANATVLDAEIQEVTADGKLVWSWNSKDHIGLDETAAWGLDNTKDTDNGQPVYDIVHLNSIEDEGDGTVVFSARHLDAVYRIRRSDGAILWKLGGSHRTESLTFVDDPLGATSFGGQHDARILPDGTLTVHDNGTFRDRPPRAVRYQLDTKAMTATRLDEVTDPRATSSGCCGSARRLAGSDWVVSWGGNPTITELTPTGDPVLTLTLATLFSYRAQPLAPGALSYAQLNAAMDAQFPR
jgi:hypothetical protein